jgi:hypothetical protein
MAAEEAARSVGDLVVTLLGVGGGTAATILLLVHIVKGAIVTAVKEAGKQELARLKAELDERLESKKQEFATTMEQYRQVAERELETFKAQLQLAAEVRRQVAAKKVAALVEIAAAGEALQRDVLNVRAGNQNDRARAMSKVHEYGHLVRSNSFLFEKTVAGKFHQYAADLVKAELDLNTKLDASALDRAMAATDGFLQLARFELGVSSH